MSLAATVVRQSMLGVMATLEGARPHASGVRAAGPWRGAQRALHESVSWLDVVQVWDAAWQRGAWYRLSVCLGNVVTAMVVEQATEA